MRADQKKNQQLPLIIFLFYFLLFIYPLLALLWRRSYQIFSAEVGILLLLAGAIAVFVTMITLKVRPSIVNALTVLFVTMIFLVQFNLYLQGIVLSLVGSLIMVWWLKPNFHLYSLPVLIALILGAWLDASEGDVSAASLRTKPQLSPVIHILLDSFIGLDGLPPYPNAAIIREESNKFFRDYNFQVFPRAYSRYSATIDSLDSALNFRNDGRGKFSLGELSRSKHVLKSNAQFELLETLGYRFNIYQTEHLDLCQSNPDSLDKCWEYAHPNVNTLQQVQSKQLRSRMLASVLLKQSSLLSATLESYKWLPYYSIAVHDPRVFSELGQDILNEPNGQYFFAHLLLPHSPFVFLSDCSINYDSDSRLRVALSYGEPEFNESVIEYRNNLYFEQMECALNSLRKIFDDMQVAGVFEQSIIVIHGDHGSMIARDLARPKNLSHLTPEQYRAIFSTLFAIKFPNSEYQVDNRVLPLSALLEGFSGAVKEYAENGKPIEGLSEFLPVEPNKVEPYIYLLGTLPLTRVDINIYED